MPEQSLQCPSCHKEMPVAGAAFCPFCGASVAPKVPVPAEALAALAQAEKAEDPKQKRNLLLAAREAYPDCLAVETELLHLGKLYERNPRVFSFDVIKCYLLHFYLTPEEFPPQKQDAMREELFEHEQLARCLALAPDEDAFMRQYLERLSREFIQLFLEGSSRYMRSIFGFTSKKNAPRLLAEPAARMLARMQSDEALSPARRETLARAFYTAFAKQMNDDTARLREILADLGCSLPC